MAVRDSSNAAHRAHHPGQGRRPGRGYPKGRQGDPAARAAVAALLGTRPRRSDLLIEFLHLIQDRFGVLDASHLQYAASKAAVANLTKTLAGALGPEVRVNAVAPGWMEGDWMQRTLGENYEGLMARRARYTPLKRCVTSDDVAETMLSLIVGNRFVTGEIVIIDGGFSNTT